ncbi:Protein-S-isoprenylcysteine O-methyltransferase Ste14 [Lentzea albidocapillata subsp. violacea]|uniref:Protein-S-isoprenylcysteine O-methyltransferase Ste14 n=1 Tax=Lentzea albidocapillata subsp. violacea TaxID=128104 RepID=A0A1H0AM44_9PSEU|nr:isoprenylcysteine carboxylmethyltransferase family protein [Lentzea albidocapillata]SDN34495.1 Protein-S-isoprenylcysteine O-methyltransferase Ste14 [Lentzea albidocapillata subsp. violacea]
MVSEPARNKRTAALLVGLQVVLLAAFAVAPTDGWTAPDRLRWAGWAAVVGGVVLMVVTAVVLGRGLTVSPLPNSRAELRTGGPYRFSRHPMYTGLLGAALGWTLVAPGILRAVMFIALAVVIVAKTRWEESYLRQRFPGYPSYARRTGRFLPRPCAFMRAPRPPRMSSS